MTDNSGETLQFGRDCEVAEMISPSMTWRRAASSFNSAATVRSRKCNKLKSFYGNVMGFNSAATVRSRKSRIALSR